MQSVDLKEFYKEPNIAVRKNGDYSFGVAGLITPKQFIKVLNIPAVDDFGRMIGGLGYHYDTMYAIICKIFNQPLPSSERELENSAKEVLPNTYDNYIRIHFNNEKQKGVISKFAYIFIPAYISQSQYIHLCILDEELKYLNFLGMNIEVGACITNYDPRAGRKVPTLKTNNDDFVPLSDMLNYMSKNKLVIPDEKMYIFHANNQEERILDSNSKEEHQKSLILNRVTESNTEANC